MSDDAKSNDQLTADQRLANELELKYWDNRETFWQRMFLGSSGFVAVATPLALAVNVADEARHFLFGAVATAAICAALLIVVMRRSTRCMEELVRKAKEVANGKCQCSEYTPQEMTKLERLAAFGAAVSIVAALVCMVGAFLSSW